MMSALQVNGLTKSYGEKKALDNFSMHISEGEIVGLVGRNGAGKTTLLNCIAGNIFPDAGSIFFDKYNLLKESEIRKDFGILIQPSFLDYMNTYDNLRLLQNAVGIWDEKIIRKQSDEVLKIVGLENKGKTYVRSFSFGMKQRLGFAQALLNGHKFMILDEPFVGLDINGREMVKEHIRKIVKEKQIGVIFSDHNLDEVRSLCERVIVIKDGEKVYDKGLEEESLYEIIVQNISKEFVEAISKIPGIEIDRDKNSLSFKGSERINQVLVESMAYTRITSIKVSENNLEKLLKGDTE
ncbi:MAG: ABC transporter ATP-binding protein [Lachnospiraceae bacterium]|nr:ABC transporter ATP-binding protein [Lachnospiraceae bacterium]